MSLKSFIAGCAGTALSDDERAFFAAEKPVGLILFARNCADKDQLRALTDSFREAVGEEDVFVLIDQEGGRVARLKPPHWRDFPTARCLGRLCEENAARGLQAVSLITQLLALELREVGINVDCMPVLDLPVPGADDIIGDRAYGTSVGTAISAGRAVADALLAGGVLPVIKHVPGHGRATADSHLALPVIEADRETLEATDFIPFSALNDLPVAMTAHVLLPAIDTEEPASTSKTIISEIIRGEIGFDGVLMCDDLSMKALSGDMGERARRVLAAGCDLALHCNGDMGEMKKVADACAPLAGDALRRVKAAFSMLQTAEEFDQERAERLRLEVLSA